MAQYFKTVLVTQKEQKCMDPLDYIQDNSMNTLYTSKNTFVNTVEREIFENPTSLSFVGEYADILNEDDLLAFENNNLYTLCGHNIPKIRPRASKKVFKYIMNNNTKQYIDKTTLEVNPLPLLCCEYNYNDYSGEDLQYVGVWSRHTVWTTSNDKHLKGFTQLSLNFK